MNKMEMYFSSFGSKQQELNPSKKMRVLAPVTEKSVVGLISDIQEYSDVTRNMMLSVKFALLYSTLV